MTTTEVLKVVNKFNYEELTKNKNCKHKMFVFRYNNKISAKTSVSKGKKEIATGTAHAILKQLRINKQNFRTAAKCTFSYEDYLMTFN